MPCSYRNSSGGACQPVSPRGLLRQHASKLSVEGALWRGLPEGSLVRRLGVVPESEVAAWPQCCRHPTPLPSRRTPWAPSSSASAPHHSRCPPVRGRDDDHAARLRHGSRALQHGQVLPPGRLRLVVPRTCWWQPAPVHHALVADTPLNCGAADERASHLTRSAAAARTASLQPRA